MVDPTLVYWIISTGPDYCFGKAIFNTRATSGATLRYEDKTMDDWGLWQFEPVTKEGVDYYKIKSYSTGMYLQAAVFENGTNATWTEKTDSPYLFTIKPVEGDPTSSMIVNENNLPLWAQDPWAMIHLKNEVGKGAATSWKFVPVTDEELQNIAIKKEQAKTYKPVWMEEFDDDGPWNVKDWGPVEGFIRNNELQWYQPQNVWIENGNMVITGKREDKPNPWYEPGSSDWRKNRQWINYTSGSLITAGKRDWLYGRMEFRAKIPTDSGAWPAIWTLGYDEVMGEWPDDGEVDIMEYYRNHSLANVCWGGWETSGEGVPLYDYWVHRVDNNWRDKYHVWRMDWDEESIRLYVDDELITNCLLSKTINSKGVNPFHYPQYLLVNVAMGATGGKIDESKLPFKLYIDYCHIYQQERHIRATQN